MNPDTSTVSAPPQEVESVSWDIATRIWWAWMWRTMLISLGIGFVLGFIIGIVGAMIGVPQQVISILGAAVGFAFGIFSGIYVLRNILSKDFKTFRIVIVQK